MLIGRAGLSMAFGLSSLGRAALHAHAFYTLGLWATSLAFPQPKPNGAAAKPPSKIAVLVVAHDESRVIVDCLRSLSAQDYPASEFAVFVVADNCSDATAELARSEGATVFERCTARLEG